ncbi:hypothetical protein EHS25_008620 [Saitozyma podzolica]|uniref:Uncharacterized protein n=1 Tax=Saitozyma podzolica TaxID=1890683 RepID=A0A427YM86_9TREE|nr:hypothetical protein EHS25_008620 [Saitozyma podzolica]
MPLRRPQKRRTAEDDADARAKKRPGKRREPTYDTYDEALDGGVEMEEKGERYRDGEKAQRFYEKAAELYKKAVGFSQTYDAVYNQARVLYTLGTSFLLPPAAVELLTESLNLHRLASTLTNSPLLQMDVGFNLAQTATSLADMLEELEGDSRKSDVRALRVEARDVLDQVLQGQAAFLEKTREEGDDETTEEAAEAMGDGGEHAEEAVQQEAVNAEDDGSVEEDETGMEVDEDEDDNDGTYETHLPTPSTFIDTVLAIVDVHLSLWESVDPPALPDAEQQGAVRAALDQAASLVPPGRQAELDFTEIKVLLTMDSIVWDLYKAEARVGTGIEKSLDGATIALSSLLANLEAQPPDEPTVRADVLTTLAETHSTIAYRMMFLAPQLPPGPSPLGQQAWFHLSQAITHLSTALDIPTTAITPREFKPSVLLSLSKASLARARLSDISDAAKRNASQLCENATTYAGRAAEGLGWGFIRLESAAVGRPAIPYQAGWDAELLAKQIALQQLRACLYAERTESVPEEKEKYTKAREGLAQRLKSCEAARRVGAPDVQRLVDDVEDEEGQMGDLEKGWWREVAEEFA